MSLQLPSDLTSTIQSFLAGGRYENEVDVVRVALASLKRDEDLAAIQKGIEDEAAGRLTPARTVLEQAKVTVHGSQEEIPLPLLGRPNSRDTAGRGLPNLVMQPLIFLF